MVDSALYYYKEALKQSNIPVNYLNLAELQVTLSATDDALATLELLNTNFHLTEQRKQFNDYYLALYFFYKKVCEIVKNQSSKSDSKELQNILAKYNLAYVPLLSDWSFRSYYNWIISSTKIDDGIKKQLIDCLCPLVPISQDKNIPCSLSN